MNLSNNYISDVDIENVMHTAQNIDIDAKI